MFDAKAWGKLESINAVFASKVRESFCDPGTFVLSLAEQGDAESAVRCSMTGLLTDGEMGDLARKLWAWRVDNSDAEGRMLRRLRERSSFGPISLASRQPDPGTIYQDLVQANPVLGLSVLEKQIKAKRALTTSTTKQEKEAASKERWTLKLAGYITAAQLPCVARIQAMSDPTAAWRRAFGSRRAGALKNRVIAWEAFIRWLEQAESSAWPSGPGAILQYFQERFEGETLFKTTASSFLGSLFLLEQVGQVPPANRLSSDSLVTEAVKSWSVELETCAPAARQAPRFTVAILLALEITLVRTGTPAGLRFACFMVLLMVWSALRCDDLQNIDPSSFSLSQLGLKFTLPRTKTSGPGKKLGALQGFVLRAVSLSGYDWISAAWSVIHSDEFNWPRDFLCVHLDDNWTVASHNFLEAEGVAALVRAVLRQLHIPKKHQGQWGLTKASHLVPNEAVTFWSGHSARHVLPSLAAAIGIPEEKINFLGRWAAAKSASSTYVQTSRQIIHQIQSDICTSLLEGKPKPGYIEEELLQELNKFGVARGLTNGLLSKAHSSLEWDQGLKAWSLGGKFPAINVDATALERAVAEAQVVEAPYEEEPTAEAPTSSRSVEMVSGAYT